MRIGRTDTVKTYWVRSTQYDNVAFKTCTACFLNKRIGVFRKHRTRAMSSLNANLWRFNLDELYSHFDER
jgi:hypothetical protein